MQRTPAFVLVAFVLVALGCAHAARAQGVGATFGAYNATAPSLTPGAFAPLQLDQGGNIKVDCTIGCGGNAGSAANPLRIVPSGVTGAPTVSTGSASAATVVLSAEPANVNRLHLVVLNLTAAGGASLYCTDDNSTPSATSASFIVYAQGFYERDAPGWVPSAVISCAPASGAVAYRAESYP